MKESLFGAYSPLIDELVHVVLSFVVAYVGYYFGLSVSLALFVFLAGSFLIDIDHVFNNFICKRILKIPNYQGSLRHGDQGYSPHIFHGIDVIFLVFVICSQIDVRFGIFLSLSLFGHLVWDFLVYPNNISWFFLTLRMRDRFKAGKRNFFVGRIFDEQTLRW